MAQDAAPLTETRIGNVTIVQLETPSLMEPAVLEAIRSRLLHLIDEQDRRRMVLDFEKVKYISSQMIGVLLSVNHECEGRDRGQLVVCGVGPRLEQLLKITKLDKLLTLKPDQKVALKYLG